MRLLRAGLLAVSFLPAAAQFAMADEATTYAGTIGKIQVIAELQAPGKDGAFYGRYAYFSKGVDIPLHGTDGKGRLTLEEEKPCTDELCRNADDSVVDKAPIGAEWLLTSNADGSELTGTWTDKDSGKSLPVKLRKKATRALATGQTGLDVLDPSYIPAMEQTPVVITPKDLPYDFLKLQHSLKTGKVVMIGKNAYRMDFHSGAGLDYPVVIRLGNADPAALNRWLMQQRLLWYLPAFSCLSQAYLGWDWSGAGGEGTNGFDDEPGKVTVDYLTPRLMGLTESGSQFCGSAHPNYFEVHRLVDAKTSKELTARTMIRGWVERDIDGNIVDPAKVEDPGTLTWGPDDKLLDYLDKNRDDSDEGAMDDCRTPDNMHSNVGIYFKDGNLVFALVDMPYMQTECAAILTKVPIKDARPLLTETGAKYFAELDQQ